MRNVFAVTCLVLMCSSACLAFAAPTNTFKVTDEGRKDSAVYYTVACANGKSYTVYLKDSAILNAEEICPNIIAPLTSARLPETLNALCSCDQQQ